MSAPARVTDLPALLAYAHELGYVHTITSRSHLRFVHTRTGAVVIAGQKPHGRTLKNAVSTLRRHAPADPRR